MYWDRDFTTRSSVGSDWDLERCAFDHKVWTLTIVPTCCSIKFRRNNYITKKMKTICLIILKSYVIPCRNRLFLPWVFDVDWKTMIWFPGQVKFYIHIHGFCPPSFIMFWYVMTCYFPHIGSCPNLDSRKNIVRYYKHLNALPQFEAAAKILPKSGTAVKGEAPAKTKVKIVFIAYRYVVCTLCW
mgnify:CR=1 FL=1